MFWCVVLSGLPLSTPSFLARSLQYNNNSFSVCVYRLLTYVSALFCLCVVFLSRQRRELQGVAPAPPRGKSRARDLCAIRRRATPAEWDGPGGLEDANYYWNPSIPLQLQSTNPTNSNNKEAIKSWYE